MYLKTLKREEIYASTYRDFEDLIGASGGIYRTVLQQVPVTFGAGLLLAGGI